MWLPAVRGVIDRRILVNYRVDPAALVPLLPAPFRPKLVGGFGVAGVCLIRLAGLRPRGVPAWLGASAESAAHRIAVEWDDGGQTREGVFVPRRDTNSRLFCWAGGRVFPGFHHHARFTVRESADRFDVAVDSDDGATRIRVRGRLTDRLPAASVFGSVDAASAFFHAGSVGYSATPDSALCQGLELRCDDWEITPLAVEEVRSSFFEDAARFPPGAAEFDSALVMRGVVHEWHGLPDLCCGRAASAESVAAT